MSVPPPGAILVWKSLDHNQVHYQLGDTIIMSHAKDGQLTAVTFLYVSKNLTACFARDSNSLYEICLFEIEKFASRLLEPDGKFLIHASSVDFNGRGLLFPAMSGFGKTFLTLVLLDHSYKLLSDDKTFVDTERMIIYPYSRRLRVDINSMKRFRNLRSFLGTATERRFLNYKAKYFIDAESAWPGARSRTLSTLSLVVFPTFWMGEATRVVPSKTEDTLSRLMTSLRLFRQELSLQEKQAALDIAARIPAYHLMMGTNISEIEKAIRTLIESPQRESSGS